VLLLLPAVLQIAGPSKTRRDCVDVATICYRAKSM